MKISIITATYNSGVTLEATLQSVACQGALANIEHIIIDSRSLDNTLDIAAQYSHVSKVVSSKDRGIYHAFNLGVQQATGDIIYFLNSDDSLHDSNVIADVLAAFQSDIDFYCGVILFVDSPDRQEYYSPTQQSDPINFKPRHQAFFCRRTLFDKLGPFNECLNIAADTYFMKDAIKRGKGLFTERGIARFSLNGVSSDERNVSLVVAQDAIVDTLLGVNSIYSDMSERLTLQVKNLWNIKNLFLKAMTGSSDFSRLQGLKVGVFGARELSQIYYLLLQQQKIDVTCFIVSAAADDEMLLGKPVVRIEDLALQRPDVVLNCVEGQHEQIVADKIRELNADISVIGWREFCEI